MKTKQNWLKAQFVTTAWNLLGTFGPWDSNISDFWMQFSNDIRGWSFLFQIQNIQARFFFDKLIIRDSDFRYLTCHLTTAQTLQGK